jgi:hypothetical protein
MISINFAVEKNQISFQGGRDNFTTSLKRKNEKNYCLTNLNKLSEEMGTEHFFYRKIDNVNFIQIFQRYTPILKQKVTFAKDLKTTFELNTLISTFQSRLSAFQELGKQITIALNNGALDAVIKQQTIENRWFTEENCRFALAALAKMLDTEYCEMFYQHYQSCFQKESVSKRIAVISAGNIPCAAFHDFFCVLVSGNQFIGKLSSQDALLLPFLSKMLVKIAPEFAEKIVFVEKLPTFDKIIATGSNNSARYFEYYFKGYPALLRKNRNSIAILNGAETDNDLRKLSMDVFQYFGLGCRSVSKIYVPENYDFKRVVEIFKEESKSLLLHNGYVNNYEYHRAIYALNRISFYDGNLFLLIQNTSLTSPISVIYYEEYEKISELSNKIQLHKNEIQCLVSNDYSFENRIAFGETQRPSLFDYPDKEDILLFCIS